MTIDVISDVVCPWCFIGRRRLGAALGLFAVQEPQFQPLVSWHPFQLNPDLPREGIDRRVYLETKFAGPRRADEIYERIAAEHGLTMRWYLTITGDSELLADNPGLARSIRNRFGYLDPLNYLQIDLLRRYRAGITDPAESELVERGIQLTLNGLATGLRNSG